MEETKPPKTIRKINLVTGVNVITMTTLKLIFNFIEGIYNIAIIFEILINFIFLIYISLVLIYLEKINTIPLFFLFTFLGFSIFLGVTILGDYSLSFLPIDEFRSIIYFLIFVRIPLMILFFASILRNII